MGYVRAIRLRYFETVTFRCPQVVVESLHFIPASSVMTTVTPARKGTIDHSSPSVHYGAKPHLVQPAHLRSQPGVHAKDGPNAAQTAKAANARCHSPSNAVPTQTSANPVSREFQSRGSSAICRLLDQVARARWLARRSRALPSQSGCHHQSRRHARIRLRLRPPQINWSRAHVLRQLPRNWPPRDRMVHGTAHHRISYLILEADTASLRR